MSSFISTPASPPVAVGTSADPNGVLSDDTGTFLVAQLAVRQLQYPMEAVAFGKASFAELLAPAVEVAVRPNGTPGRHREAVWRLTEGEAQQLIDLMVEWPLKDKKKAPKHPAVKRAEGSRFPSASRSNGFNGTSAAADPRVEMLQAQLLQQGQQLAAMMEFLTAPKVQPTEGHTVNGEGNVESATPISPNQKFVLPNGEIRYASVDCQRLNKFPS